MCMLSFWAVLLRCFSSAFGLFFACYHAIIKLSFRFFAVSVVASCSVFSGVVSVGFSGSRAPSPVAAAALSALLPLVPAGVVALWLSPSRLGWLFLVVCWLSWFCGLLVVGCPCLCCFAVVFVLGGLAVFFLLYDESDRLTNFFLIIINLL